MVIKLKNPLKTMMPDDTHSQLKLIQLHMGWYPLMEPRDIYKLLYQGVMGAEHLVSSADQFTQQLVSEFDHLLPDPSTRLLEPVRPDSTLLRLNLRRYKSVNAHVETLFPLLLATARSYQGDKAELGIAWTGLVGYCEQGLIQGYELAGIRRFTSWLETSHYPAVHHSNVYRQQYQPAYRLISSSFARQLGLSYVG